MQTFQPYVPNAKSIKLGLLSTMMVLPLFCFAQSAHMPVKAFNAPGAAEDSMAASSTLPDAPDGAAVVQTEVSSSVMASASTPTRIYVYPSRGQRAHAYLYDLLGPGAFVAPAISSVFDQTHPLKVGYPADGFTGAGLHPAHGTVPEWGEGFDGYSKRYADRLGQGLINTTGRYALGEILREDVTYHRCSCTGVAPRAIHALSQIFVAHTQSGRAVPSIAAIVSPYLASEAAVAAWYPSRFNSSDALRISIPMFVGALPRTLLAEFKKGK